METLFSHLRISVRDVCGHLTSCLEVKMVCCDCMEEEKESFSQIIKAK